MKVKIWGARGSIPAPLEPEAVREKIVSAIAGIAKLKDYELREELMSAILESPDHSTDLPGPPTNVGLYEQVVQKLEAKRRKVIEDYVDNLSPLGGATAGGNTPCIQIQSGDDIIIIDAGSGIRELGLALMDGPCGRGEGIIHLLFSHPHWDHIQGFPFFRPAFIPGNKIYFYSVHDIEAALRRQQEFISFPISLDYMQADKIFRQIKVDEVLNFNDLRVRTIRNEHPGDAYGYRFEKGNKVFVYASDSAYPEDVDRRPYLNFFADADVLIFDAQFTQRESDEKEDWGHSSSFVGVEMAQEANVKSLALFHYDPTYSDQELEEILERTLKFQRNQYPKSKPVEISVAQEGQMFDLAPSQTTEVQQVPGSQATILKPAGVFDEHVAGDLKEQLADMTHTEVSPPQLIIDMSAVQMLQVVGLRALVKLRKERQGEGISMALVNPTDNVRQLIELAGYLDFFAIYDTIHAALNALQARDALNLPGQVLKKRYRIESKIGEGRLGTVFKAIDIQNNTSVAVKILSASFSEGAIKQFIKQTRQIVGLAHPNIVDVHDCDVDRGISFMVEEFVEGKTLQVLMNNTPGQPLPFDLALSMARSITQALKYAHTNGVVHGDLKPANVLLSANEAKISDFGLGRLESGRTLINIDVPLALVTARYLAPEQIMGHPIDARTDLYALGVILYELFTGQPPFDGSDRKILELHRNQQPPSPRKINTNLSRSLEHLILKLLDKDPTKRYSNARQVDHILSSMSDVISGDVQHRVFSIEQWPTLAGHEKILQRLSDLWRETQQGHGQAVFIHGALGVGKTRLTQELMQQLDELTILVGECQKAESSEAYAPFISALKTYFDTTPPDIAHENVGRVWQDIIQFMPTVAKVLPPLPSISTNVESNSNLVESFSLAESIAQVTANRPWLLILNNLHRADHCSVRLLDYLVQHCDQMSLMIIGIYEDTHLEANEFLATTLKKLTQKTNCTQLSPEALSKNKIRTLLESIWSQTVPDDWVAAIYKHTQGNPLYAKEIAKELTEADIVRRQGDEWHFGDVAKARLPKNINETILHRVRHLSRETQTFLNQIAVLDPVIKFDDLHEMSDLSAWDALESLDIALQRQLLKEAPGEKIVRFSHIKIQQIIYNKLSPLKQQLLHREAGEALERQYMPEPKRIAAALTHHFLQAGELEKGLIYSIQAAKQAQAIFANQNALYWYTQALDVMNQLGMSHVTQEQRFELLLAREQTYNFLGLRQAQATDLASLQSLAQNMDIPLKQAQVHVQQAAYEYVMGRLTEATTEAQAGLIAARQANSSTLEGGSLVQLAQIALHQGQLNQVHKYLHTAQETLKDSDNPHVEARRLLHLGTLHKFLNDYPESERYYQQALTIYQQAGNWPGLANCLSNLGDLLLKKGDYTLAKSYQERALVIQQFIENRPGEAKCLNRLATMYKTLGQYDTSENYAEQALLLHRTIEDEQGIATDLHTLGAIYRTKGDDRAARDNVGQALEIFQHTKNKLQEGNAWLEVGLALEGLDDYTKAGHAYSQAKLLQAEVGDEPGTFDASAGLARCLLVQGNAKNAHQEITPFLKVADQILGQNGTLGMQYPIRLYATAYQVLQIAGHPQEALHILQQGHNLLQKLADAINDSHLQISFLENVPEHQELLAQLEKHKAKETAN